MRNLRGTYVHRGDVARRRKRLKRTLYGAAVVAVAALALAARHPGTANAEIAMHSSGFSLGLGGGARALREELDSTRGEMDLLRARYERADRIIDAIGPETYSYRGLVQELARILGVRRPIVSVPAPLGYAAGWLLGKLLRDVLITRDEVEGLMQGLLATRSQPTGRTKLSSWAQEHATTLGRRYATELGRRKDRRVAYVNAK